MKHLAQLLKQELELKQSKNASYSLRSFASYLEVSPATLSQVISGKRGISSKKTDSILEKLGHSKAQINSLSNSGLKFTKIDEDKFKLISKWYYYGILSLSELKDAKSDPRWIAKKLKITVKTASDALQRLVRLGIIDLTNHSYSQIGPMVSTSDDIPSNAIKNFHKGMIDQAYLALDEVQVEDREIRAMTMAIDKKNLMKAKKLTREYTKQMMNLLENGERTEVYQLNVQLFPLTRK